MIEIKIGKRDAVARVLDVELVRIRRGRYGGWCLVRNGKVASSAISALEMATDGALRAWLEKEARRVAASELEGARNVVRGREERVATARHALASAEAEVPEARERLARAERIMDAIGGPK